MHLSHVPWYMYTNHGVTVWYPAYNGRLWYLLFVTSWYTMVHLWYYMCTTVYHGMTIWYQFVPWYLLLSFCGIPWYICVVLQLYHGLPWYIMVYHGNTMVFSSRGNTHAVALLRVRCKWQKQLITSRNRHVAYSAVSCL